MILGVLSLVATDFAGMAVPWLIKGGIDTALHRAPGETFSFRYPLLILAAAALQGKSAAEVFGHPDDLKLRSCATLFARVSPAGSVFERLLDKYFQGGRDDRTLRLMGIAPETE